MTRKIIKKADPLFYEKVGKYIELWLRDNRKARNKPGTSKECANMLRISPPQLSRYINGINEMPPEIMSQLINNFNFNGKYYEEFLAHKGEYKLDGLTKEDLYKLIRELQILNDKNTSTMLYYADRAGKYSNDNNKLVLQMSKLIDDMEKLRKENRDMRKQLKIED